MVEGMWAENRYTEAAEAEREEYSWLLLIRAVFCNLQLELQKNVRLTKLRLISLTSKIAAQTIYDRLKVTFWEPAPKLWFLYG